MISTALSLVCGSYFSWLRMRAYELGTHARLTQETNRSVLVKDEAVLIDIAKADPFGEVYCDVSGTIVRERKANAIREDDYCTAFGIWFAPNPKDDQEPPRRGRRYLVH